jgi:predicted dehydrogenase
VPYGPIIYGTTGVLVIEKAKEGEGQHVREEHGGGKTTIHQPDPLPQGRHNIAYEFIHHLETGDPVHPTLDALFNLNAQAILDAGLRSAGSGKLETVDAAPWCIG